MSTKKYKNFNLEDVMRKVLSILAMTLMIVGLSGCLDDQNMGNPKPKGYGTPNQEGSGAN
jgi:hypothetical protein